MPNPANRTLSFQPAGAFARDLNAAARAWLNGAPRFGDTEHALVAADFAAMGVAAYGQLLIGSGGAWQASALIAAAAFCAFMLIVQVGHDAAHGALSPRAWVNRAGLFWTFAVFGADSAQWRDRHLRLHHQVVNLPGTGIDADSVSLMRLAPDKTWHWWMRLQPLYGPLLFAIGHVVLVWFEDFRDLRAHRRDGRREFMGPRALAKFVAGKAVHAALFLVVPWLVLRPTVWHLAAGYLLASGVIAICFVALVVGTHISTFAEFPTPDADGRLPHDWATHQVVTSVDWSPTSRLAVLLSGGANAHVAHHLFPGYHHRHLAKLSEVVARTAGAHGLALRVTTFGGMVLGQWRHLMAMSRGPHAPDRDSVGYSAR